MQGGTESGGAAPTGYTAVARSITDSRCNEAKVSTGHGNLLPLQLRGARVHSPAAVRRVQNFGEISAKFRYFFRFR